MMRTMCIQWEEEWTDVGRIRICREIVSSVVGSQNQFWSFHLRIYIQYNKLFLILPSITVLYDRISMEQSCSIEIVSEEFFKIPTRLTLRMRIDPVPTMFQAKPSISLGWLTILFFLDISVRNGPEQTGTAFRFIKCIGIIVVPFRRDTFLSFSVYFVLWMLQ